MYEWIRTGLITGVPLDGLRLSASGGGAGTATPDLGGTSGSRRPSREGCEAEPLMDHVGGEEASNALPNGAL